MGFFQDLICLCDTCEWARISELRTDEVEDLVEGGEAPVEENSGFVPADSPPYRATSPIFFPVRSQDPGLSSPQYPGPSSLQYPGPTSPEYFPSSSGHSPTDLSDLLEELFSFPDPLVGVEEFEPFVDLVEPFADLVEPLDSPVDLVEPPVEPEQVVEPPRKKRRRKRRIRYPQRFPVKCPYRKPLPEAPLYLERCQSDHLAATPRVDYADMTW